MSAATRTPAPADDHAAEDMHRARPEAAEEDEREADSSILDEIAHVFKGGERQRHRDGGGLDLPALRLEYQKIERQRQPRRSDTPQHQNASRMEIYPLIPFIPHLRMDHAQHNTL